MSGIAAIAADEADDVQPISRREWLHMRAYFREKDVAEKNSGARRKRNRHRVGRPPKAKEDKAMPWRVWLSNADRNHWKRLARQAGMTPDAWLRSKLLSGV